MIAVLVACQGGVLVDLSKNPHLANEATATLREEMRRERPMHVIDPTAHRYDGPGERGLPDRRK